MDQLVERVREFNRFYLPEMDLLGNHYLGSEFSVSEARIFYELYCSPGCSAAQIARTMHLDKSYLSRVLKGHERNGYLYKKPSLRDARVSELYLTPMGLRRAETFIRQSNEQITARLADLTEGERQELQGALETVMDILGNRGTGGEKQ